MFKLVNSNKIKDFSLFFVLGIILYFVMGQAPGPEKNENFWFALPAFFVFVIYFLSICSLGAIIREKVNIQFFSEQEKGVFDLAVGASLFYILAHALAVIGLFAASKGLVLWLILSTILAFGFRKINILNWFKTDSKNLGAKILMAILPLMVLIKLIEGLQFHQQGDAYITYLVGPRSLGSTGSFENFIKYPQAFLSTSFETLYSWGTALMGFTGGKGLDISQWFSQWVTAGIGFAGTMLAMLAILKRMVLILPIPEVLLPAIVLAGIQVPAIRWTQNLAKNDTGVGFFGVSAFFLTCYVAPLSNLSALLTGIVAGSFFVGKFVTVTLASFMFFYLLIKNRKVTPYYVLGGLIGVLPILIRNFVLTQNPVFPWLPSLFPSSVVNEFMRLGAAAATHQVFELKNLTFYLNELIHESYLIPALVLVFFFTKKKKELFSAVVVPVAAFFAFMVFFRPSTEMRYQSASLMLFSLFATLSAFYIAEKINRYLVYPLLVFVLIFCNLTLFTLLQIGNREKFAAFPDKMPKTRYIGGHAKTWIRQNIDPKSKLISFGDIHIYYLIDYDFVEVSQSEIYGKKLYSASLKDAVQILKEAPFDYLYLAKEDYFKGEIFNNVAFLVGDLMTETLKWNQQCKLFDNEKAYVWDLNCVRK